MKYTAVNYRIAYSFHLCKSTLLFRGMNGDFTYFNFQPLKLHHTNFIYKKIQGHGFFTSDPLKGSSPAEPNLKGY